MPGGCALPRVSELGPVPAAQACSGALQEEAGIACGVCFLPPSLGEQLAGEWSPVLKASPKGAALLDGLLGAHGLSIASPALVM